MTLDECDRLCRQVRSASSLAEACYALAPIIDAHELFEVSIARGRTLYYRVRVCEAAPWTSIRSMVHPPASVARAGRLNDDRAPMFYASMHEDTALAEVVGPAGTFVQVAAFKLIPGQELRLTTLGELAHVYKAGYLRMVGEDPGHAIYRLIKDNSVQRTKLLLYLDSFLADILSDKDAGDTEYRLTRALASMVLQDPKTEGILYPSVKDTVGTNIALRPAAVAKLAPVMCFHARIGKVRPYGIVDYETLWEATDVSRETGAISWRRPFDPDQHQVFNATKEEWERAMRFERTRATAPRWSSDTNSVVNDEDHS
jgi:RES domain